GEAQRIRLAAQLGSNLQGVCYVLDEPTIGLHSRDNQILLTALHKLGEKGNTLVVVEHDEDTIRRADHIIDIGPSAGKRGGRVVAQGSAADISAVAESVTGRYLMHAMKHPVKPRRAVIDGAQAALLPPPPGGGGGGGGQRPAGSEGCWGDVRAPTLTLPRKGREQTEPCNGCACAAPTCTTWTTSISTFRCGAWSR